MEADLAKLAQTPPDAIDREHAISLILGYLGSSLKGVHDERDYLAEDPEIRMQACIARAATSQLQAPESGLFDHTRNWGHLHCTDNLQPYRKHKTQLKELMRALGLRIFVCPEPLLSPSDYAALLNANIVIASPNSFIEQLGIGLQFGDLNPWSLFTRRLTLSCDLDVNKLSLVAPPEKMRLFSHKDMLGFVANTGQKQPGMSFSRPVAPGPLTDHDELNYRINFLQFAAGLEWNQRYLTADSVLLGADTESKIVDLVDLSSRMLGARWITAPEYFDARNFHDNVSRFMSRFELGLEQKGIEEIEREMPAVYRQYEQSVINMASMLDKTPQPLNRLIDFQFQRSISDWMRAVYRQELSNLWQEFNRLIEARRSDGTDAAASLDRDKKLSTNLDAGFRRKLRERLLESPYLA